jgi:hypothetical protein
MYAEYMGLGGKIQGFHLPINTRKVPLSICKLPDNTSSTAYIYICFKQAIENLSHLALKIREVQHIILQINASSAFIFQILSYCSYNSVGPIP